MGSISFETVKGQKVQDSGFRVGDILYGTSYMYGIHTYWFVVIGMTSKRLRLRELQCSYESKYMSNVMVEEGCMPILEIPMTDNPSAKKTRYFAEGYPYWVGERKMGIYEADVYKTRDVETFYEDGKVSDVIKKEWEYEAKVRGARFPMLSLWKGETGKVMSD